MSSSRPASHFDYNSLLLTPVNSATVGNLQAKVESLTTTNALMKEDLAIARNSLMALQAENAALRRASQHGQPLDDKTNVLDRFDPEMAEALAEERKKRQEIEKELTLQVCTRVISYLKHLNKYLLI